MRDEQPTYLGAPDTLIAVWEERREPLRLARGERLPPFGVDLAALAATVLPDLPPQPARGHGAKLQALRADLAGNSELALLNAICIAHLRKRSFPRLAKRLFLRIWAEQGPRLCADLPTRWLISSAITFADHGTTEAQRRLGQSLNVLFSLMKLYEYERLTSGLPPSAPFAARTRILHALPLGMPGFSLLSGGLDVNLLAPIWKLAQQVEVLGPLALHLLETLNHDPGTLFHRLQVMREAAVEVRARRQMRRGAAAAGEP